VIELRNKWHEGDPPKPGWRSLLGVGGWLLAVTAIFEKIVGG
jgi:hypothetical protein